MIFRVLLIMFLATAVLFAASPVRVACMLDQTESTHETRVPQLKVGDFEDLLSLISEVGGELAVGAIRDQSDRPLLRCRMEPRPAQELIQPPDPNMNVFQRQKLIRKYLADKQEADRQDAAWRDRNRMRADSFRRKLQELLGLPLADRTDIRSALARARLFLDEPDGDETQPPFRFCLLHTDGLETLRARGPLASMGSGTTVLVVNGSASLGLLAPLHPVQMEGFAAAVRYLRNRLKENSSR
jgi:hypothetical protein